MRTTINFEAKDYPLEEVLFSALRFKIPRYQRPFMWQEDHLSDFWNDLTTDDAPVFIGSFILNREPFKETGYVEVIDGQQRMLTVTIFSAVLRDLAKKFDDKLANLIQEFEIAQKDKYGDYHMRILPGESTAPYFRKYIQNDDKDIFKSHTSTKEEQKIKFAYEYLNDKIQYALHGYETDKGKIEYLKKLREKISNLIVIRIDIDCEEDAYEIFETTNARGIDLSVADLLKNLIFKNVRIDNDKGDFAKEVWGDIVSNVEDTNTEMRRFIRYFWISKHPSVTDKRLYKTIKKVTIEWDKLLDNLWTSSMDYNKLLAAGKDLWIELSPTRGSDMYRSVLALRHMGVMQCHVFLLSILRNLNKLKTDPKRIFELIEKFSFNYAAICKLPANKVENLYSNFANQLDKAVNKGPDKHKSGNVHRVFDLLESELKKLRPSFEVFQDRFIEVSYGNHSKGRSIVAYILEKIERHKSTGEKKTDFDLVNIEHILPRNPSKAWKVDKKQIKNYVNIGELDIGT